MSRHRFFSDSRALGEPVIDGRLRCVSRDFFDLDVHEKEKVARPANNVARGHIGVDEESLARSRDPEAYGSDLNESLMIGPVDTAPADYALAAEAGKHFAPNWWPDAPGSLQTIWTDYYRTMGGLAQTLMRVFAVALTYPKIISTPPSTTTSAACGCAITHLSSRRPCRGNYALVRILIMIA